MAFYASNLIVVLIVFYSMKNLDNADCQPTREELIECLETMKVYCGNDLTNVLNCAKMASILYSIPSVKSVCASDDLLKDQEFMKKVNVLIDASLDFVSKEAAIQVIIDACQTRLLDFFKENSVQNIFIKQGLSETTHTEMFSENNTLPGERKIPDTFCHTFK